MRRHRINVDTTSFWHQMRTGIFPEFSLFFVLVLIFTLFRRFVFSDFDLLLVKPNHQVVPLYLTERAFLILKKNDRMNK